MGVIDGKRRLLRSVRLRLTVWYTIMVAAMLLVLSLGVHLLVRASLRKEITQEFERNLSALERVVRDSPKHLQFFDEHSTVDFFVVKGADEYSYESEDWKNESLDPVGFSFRGLSQWPWVGVPEKSYRFQSRDVVTPSGTWTVTIAQNAAPYERTLSELTGKLLLAAPFALLIASLAGYFLAGRVLKPVGLMASQASQITAENLSQRLPVDNPDDEFGKLATVFNQTLTRLEGSFDQLRRFTSDASHELRTPLTAIRSVGEVGLAEPFNAEMCREAVASMLEETDRLARLVEGLLTLTRGDSHAVPLNVERFNVHELASNVGDLLRVLAEEKEQQLEVSGDDAVFAYGDHGILRQAVINIVDNAVRYSNRGGRITVTVTRRNSIPCIEVRDEGPGIERDFQQQIFERFYRINEEQDGVRAGGCGLGLAIAKWAVEVNQGRIELESARGMGSQFTVLFSPRPFVPVAKLQSRAVGKEELVLVEKVRS